MTNILVITTHLLRQGPNVQLYYLCKYLDKSKVSILVAVIDKQRDGVDMTSDFVQLGVQITNLNLNKYSCLYKAKSILQNIIILNDIDVVYSFSIRSNYFASKLPNVISITSIRNTLKVNSMMVYGTYLGFLIYKIQKYFILKFDAVLSCSETVQEHLNEHNINSIVVKNSIESSGNNDPKSNYIVNNSFITISSKLKGKNIEFLLDSFTTNDYMKKFNLKIAGFVKKKILVKYEKQPNILFLGHVRNLESCLLESDYFISSSLHEGLPNAVLESMKIGTPVVLSDIPSHKEIIDNSDLIFGVLFENNNINSLVKAVENIQEIHYSKLSTNALRVINNYYNPEIMAKNFMRVINNFKHKLNL